MKLLARHKLVKTGPVDYADWNYRLALSTILRLRYRAALSLRPAGSGRLLEIGFGSGVFMPTLRDMAGESGRDRCSCKRRRVKRALASEGIHAQLLQATAEALPFQDRWFDSIVAVSSLEFVNNLDLACSEIHRVLKPRGVCIVITPRQSAILDAGLWLLTGNSAKRDFGKRRATVVPTLRNYFDIESHRKSSAPPGVALAFYDAIRLTPATYGRIVTAGYTLLLLFTTGVAAAGEDSFGSVRGTVTNGVTGDRLRKAYVRLALVGDDAHTRPAVTDAEGRFVFEKVPAGNYSLEAEHPGLMESKYGEDGGAPVELRIVAGQNLSDLTIKLMPPAVISGPRER